MKQYILQIIGAALLAVFADLFAPDGWKKYIGIISGMILLTVIITPIADFKNIDVYSGFNESESMMINGNEIYGNLLKKEFSKKLEEDIKSRISEEFSKNTTVRVELLMNNEGNIEKILSIDITGKNLNKEISSRISYVYNADEVRIHEA